MRTQLGGNMVVFDSPTHLHGNTPSLHGREAIAHVAVAAIGGGLGCVRLRQISPHGCDSMALHLEWTIRNV